MAIHIALHHRTHYRYDKKVAHAPHIVRLRPAPHCRTNILSYTLKVEPRDHFINWQQDPFGNYLARLVFPEKAGELLVEVDLVAEMAVHNPFDFFLDPEALSFPFEYEKDLAADLRPFLKTAPLSKRLKEYLHSIDRTEEKTVDFLMNLNRRLWKEIQYGVRMEPGVQSPEKTLQLAHGSCRDTAWLMVTLLRNLGLAARFASGYLIQLRPDQKSLDGPSGAETDFTDLHAWCEVYLPGAGWIGLDPTSGLLAGEGHLPLACTPEPTSAAPVSGSVDPCESTFEHHMEIARVLETPRVSLPYSDEQWEQIQTVGKHVDQRLKKQDVRLTMGGEPTFVSIDDMEGVEWNYTAVGPNKRRLAETLIGRLHDRFSPGGLLHFGQGKWYPGEPLPRWALNCYWRKDGSPIWNDPSLIATEGMGRADGVEEAQRFILTLADRLEVNTKHACPAYEDAWYYLWREKRLPTNVDPLKSNLSDPIERQRLAKVFQHGIDQAVGYALPIQKNGVNEWESGPWFLRQEHLFLMPGDSPMGLRLPLDSLPWVDQRDYPHVHPRDPQDNFPPLPSAESLSRSNQGYNGARKARIRDDHASRYWPPSDQEPEAQQSASWIVRTALCVEPREGRLHVFMPPLEKTGSYLELITAIEETAKQLNLPVVIEGERPPFDPQLNHLSVTPDPGVIEVNLHPVKDWPEAVHVTETLYEQARETRLGTEKFMIDGRHVGTGGGNHLVLGGETPGDSPFLRRPDLLRSLVNYWQNHPSLSYLFSGLFVGPTSQHPRIDEARNDALYEMEIAFQQIPQEGDSPPWLVDRLFRNLLVDATGNTHRSEISIDKLYSPESSNGRLGLVEMRAFEMPPHARMSLAQQLLLRALVARFWKAPYEEKLVRWRTEIHDRFMLPHFNEIDFQDVIADLNRHDLPLKDDWFAPHFEFRFPRYGNLTRGGVSLEIRHALEPWHVLGEQGSAGATVRLVDSSVERLQVKVTGLTEGRHIISCNGYQVPIQPTDTETEAVAGVRYRAWQPAECLHPTIQVHSPLTFDIIDTWNKRSLGGCRYHVAHPGGRNHSRLPVNAYEAESRRLARFFHSGHTPGPVKVAQPPVNNEFPFTLDLRTTT